MEFEQEKERLGAPESRVISSAFDPSSIAASTVVSRTPTVDDNYDGIRQSQYSEDHKGDSAGEHHVDIEGAKREFAKLERALTQNSLKDAKRDLEKDDEDERFDLRDYFQNSHDASDANGVRHKHVGVVWDDLSVEVLDIGSKVRPPRLNGLAPIVHSILNLLLPVSVINKCSSSSEVCLVSQSLSDIENLSGIDLTASCLDAIFDTLSYPIFYPLGLLQSKFGKGVSLIYAVYPGVERFRLTKLPTFPSSGRHAPFCATSTAY